MSGIAAVWRLDGAPLERLALERVIGRLAPRVPDATGAWLEGPVGLAHRMLHTTPESLHEKLPLASDTGDVVATVDARLDNREELIAALGLEARAAEGIGDGELVLRAWERWGEACPARLLGDFAFALWDARRRILFCARDPTGVRPLYYHLSPRLFAAASEVRALLALPDVPRRLDEVRIAGHLVPELHGATATYYEAIRRLPGGHSIAVGTSGGEPRAYWELDPSRELRYGSDAAYAEAYRELFTDAVRCRLRSALPVAAALSGGLDSSSVVCVARTLRPAGAEPLFTYTARFPTIPRCDEGSFVGAVEAAGGVAPRHVRADVLDPLGDLERAPEEADETFYAPGYYMHRTLYHAARAEGRRVFLEGTGGDLVVSHGTGYLHDLARRARWLSLAGEVHQLAGGAGRPFWRVLRTVTMAAAPPRVRHAWWRLRYGQLSRTPVLRPEFARRIALDDRLRAAAMRPGSRSLEGTRREHWQQLAFGRLPGILETLAVSAGGAGVDARDPFLDRRLVEFCLALPASQKIRNGQTRMVARHALRDVLPPEIGERRGKAPIDLMLGAALAAYGRERLAGLLDAARDVLAPYVTPEVIQRARERYLTRGAHADERRAWQLAVLTLWLRRAAG